MAKEKNTLAGLNEKELKAYAEKCRQALFTLKLNAQSAHVKDYSQFKKLRRECARTLTHLRHKELTSHGTNN
jgi:ribosomal protein L29